MCIRDRCRNDSVINYITIRRAFQSAVRLTRASTSLTYRLRRKRWLLQRKRKQKLNAPPSPPHLAESQSQQNRIVKARARPRPQPPPQLSYIPAFESSR